MNNDALLADLNRWARDDARIDPPTFDCRHYDSCNASANDELDRGAGCLMSYVGRQYGRNATGETGEAFRLVIVGIDHGEPEGGTFEKCRADMEKCYQEGGKNFNPHYKGVVKTAAAIFGKTGEYCREKCRTSCQKSRDPAAAWCVIDRIVQPNSVKCTPKDTVDRTSRATSQMMVNCADHLVDELKLLKPGLVVFHGVNARWIIRPKFAARGLDLNAVSDVKDRHDCVLYESRALAAHVLFLYQPAFGHLEGQWDSVVVPALKLLRSRNCIPE
jgi:hypothetical protein